MALARRYQIASPGQAAGRCLAAALQVAGAASGELDVEVWLLRWRVRDDAHYVDHWAVRLDDNDVVDPTRVQVDGKRRLVSSIDDYPANYVSRRCYPASLLLEGAAVALETRDRRLPNRFLWACGIRCFVFDSAKSIRAGEGRVLASVLLELARFVACFMASALKNTLEKRATTLVGRMRRHADIAALSPVATIRGVD